MPEGPGRSSSGSVSAAGAFQPSIQLDAPGTNPVGRFLAIDGLRGVAALAVVCYHFLAAIDRSAPVWMPLPLREVFERGYLGVDIFFVLSGFVIAYSVRNGDLTVGYFGRFVARRSVRLDPPYWCAIVLEILLILVGIWIFPSLSTPLPTPAQVVSHLFYAQGLLGYGDILSIFWTLCYEIQFYLFFVGCLVAWNQLRIRSLSWHRLLAYGFFGVLFVASLLDRFGAPGTLVQGLALDRWFQFFLGVLAWWVLSKRAEPAVLGLAWASVAGLVAFGGAGGEQLVAVAASAFIYFAGRQGRLHTALASRPLQFLGTISYSLYLFHLPIGWRLIGVAEKVYGDALGPLAAWTLYLAGIAASIAAAWLFYRLVEAPTIRLSKRIRLPSAKGTLLRSGTAEPLLAHAP